MKKKTLFFAVILSLVLISSLQAQYKIGDVITDFSLKNVDNKMVSLSQFKTAKGFIIVFTSNTCPFANKYESRIKMLDKEFKGKNYPVIAIGSNDVGINPGDSFEEMQKKSKDDSFTFPYLHDETQEIAKNFGATNTPHVFVVAKENNQMVLKYMGAIDNNVDDASKADKKYVADAVNSLLDGKNPAVSSTKAIGCGIKWKK
ncbi:MAG: thioredoxin family protein [Bacteroidales bacterium]|nr:thioredoxin family protein [Bacteroidales bacterium]